MKLNLSANPRPSDADVILYKNGHELHRVPGGTINLHPDSVGIQRVDKPYEGTYTIKSSTTAGEGQLKFRLQVAGNYSITD